MDKPAQEYIGNLAHTLLLIQNSCEIGVKEQETRAQISLKNEGDGKFTLGLCHHRH